MFVAFMSAAAGATAGLAPPACLLFCVLSVSKLADNTLIFGWSPAAASATVVLATPVDVMEKLVFQSE